MKATNNALPQVRCDGIIPDNRLRRLTSAAVRRRGVMYLLWMTRGLRMLQDRELAQYLLLLLGALLLRLLLY